MNNLKFKSGWRLSYNKEIHNYYNNDFSNYCKKYNCDDLIDCEIFFNIIKNSIDDMPTYFSSYFFWNKLNVYNLAERLNKISKALNTNINNYSIIKHESKSIQISVDQAESIYNEFKIYKNKLTPKILKRLRSENKINKKKEPQMELSTHPHIITEYKNHLNNLNLEQELYNHIDEIINNIEKQSLKINNKPVKLLTVDNFKFLLNTKATNYKSIDSYRIYCSLQNIKSHYRSCIFPAILNYYEIDIKNSNLTWLANLTQSTFLLNMLNEKIDVYSFLANQISITRDQAKSVITVMIYGGGSKIIKSEAKLTNLEYNLLIKTNIYKEIKNKLKNFNIETDAFGNNLTNEALRISKLKETSYEKTIRRLIFESYEKFVLLNLFDRRECKIVMDIHDGIIIKINSEKSEIMKILNKACKKANLFVNFEIK